MPNSASATSDSPQMLEEKKMKPTSPGAIPSHAQVPALQEEEEAISHTVVKKLENPSGALPKLVIQ
jgi:hypothetical protein